MKLASLAAAAMLVLAATGSHARTWNFRVLLDGEVVGHHRFTREAEGAGTLVVSEARFDVRFLFLTAYRYEHRAEERWRGPCVESLEARTDDNGARREVRLRPDGCVKTFAYWNPDILAESRLLNAQTGEVMPVRAAALGVEQVEVRGALVDASRHRLTAPGLSIDLWYAGREWVALESTVEGGRRLRYERT